MKTALHNRAIIASGILGVLVSTYALYVEMAAEARPGYKALCDIFERASCSRVLTSEYSKGFGILPKDSPLAIPNCIYGTIFYCLIIFLDTFDNMAVVRLQLFLCLTSVAACFYLAYLLIFVLHDFCFVCVPTYIVSGILTALVYKKINFLSSKNK